MAYKGIDVSKHNGVIDWQEVKKDGVEFAMIRAGYGRNAIDSQFRRNISECNRLGIPCGVYWFSYALNEADAKQEALYCLDAVKPYKLEYPIAYDFEYDSVDYAKKNGVNITKEKASSFVKAFCDEIENAGYFVLNYTNIDYMKNYFTDAVNVRYGLWLAAWVNSESPPKSCYIWQHSSTGKVKGISGNVDMNKSYIDFPKFLKDHNMNRLNDKWYTPALEWAITNGITDGENPEDQATRAQVIVMLKRFHDKFIKQ